MLVGFGNLMLDFNISVNNKLYEEIKKYVKSFVNEDLVKDNAIFVQSEEYKLILKKILELILIAENKNNDDNLKLLGEGDYEVLEKKLSNVSINPGGSVANIVINHYLLTEDSILVGFLGKDNFGKIYDLKLKELGIKKEIKEIDEDNSVAICLINEDGERTFIDYVRNFKKEDFDEKFYNKITIPNNEKGYLLVEGYSLFDEQIYNANLQILRKAKKENIKTFMDMNDANVSKNKLNYLLDNKLLTIFTVNESEAIAYFGKDWENKIMEFSELKIIVTRGKNGVLIKDEENKIHEISTKQNDNSISLTGAGDGFKSGYLLGQSIGLNELNSAKLGHEIAGRIINQHEANLIGMGEDIKEIKELIITLKES